MLKQIMSYLLDIRDRQRIAIALSKGAAMMQSRMIDLTRPQTWEFSGFSQNGEDGILDVLRKKLLTNNRYFIEIGAADGIENNSGWLVVAEKYSGLMIEGDSGKVVRANRVIVPYSIGAKCHNIFVSRENIHKLNALAIHQDPDIFSLDIDGIDYYIAKELLGSGFRPKIFVVEYNSVYGPNESITVEYADDFDIKSAHHTELYYGVSVAGWRNFFTSYGYRFVTVDQNGVNAFFVDPDFFESSFLNNINGLEYTENMYQYVKFGIPSEKQFELIKDQNFVAIET